MGLSKLKRLRNRLLPIYNREGSNGTPPGPLFILPHWQIGCALFILLSSFVFHDFHTSLTQMHFEARSQTVEISVRMFTDDLETALTRENGGKPVRLSGPVKPDQLLEKYVRRHFIVADARRKQRIYTYLGYEQEADAYWVYLEMPASGADTFRNIVIKQDILMDLFDDQVNLINIQYNQQKKTLVFRNNQPVQAVSL